MQILDIIPGTTKWLFLIAILAFYAIGWVAWRVQNDCIGRGYGPMATAFWSIGTLFLFFPIFPLYLLMRERLGIKSGAPVLADPEVALAGPELLCTSCGTGNPVWASACENCGELLVPAEAKTGVGSVSCPVCGAQNPIGAGECTVCHQTL